MFVAVIVWSLLTSVVARVCFQAGKRRGFRKKEKDERDRALVRYLRERKDREAYCLHCEHGIIRTTVGMYGARTERAVCGLRADCRDFKIRANSFREEQEG